MEQRTRRVLLAVNGSDESMTAVRYACGSLPPRGSEITLFQVLSSVPEEFWDLEKDPAWAKKIEIVRAWEDEQKKRCNDFMDRACAHFRASAFPADAVTTKIGVQKEGIARDVIREGKNNYHALVIGRGESGSNPQMPLGGVTSKLIAHDSLPSIWLIGGAPLSSRLLIALDSSPQAISLVEHVAAMFDCRKLDVTLFHAIRGISVSIQGMESIFPSDYAKSITEDAQTKIGPIMERAKTRLIEVGVPADNISIKIANGVTSRASAIVEEAVQGKFGTIVCGRRGVSQVDDFSMGRVANKLTQLARSQALCIVA